VGSRGRRGRRKQWKLLFDMGIELVETVETLTERPYIMPEAPANDIPQKGYLVVGSRWDGAKSPYYPLFPQDRGWILVARDGESLDEHPLHEAHNFGMSKPTLAWQNGTQRMELYVDGMSHIEFMAAYGLQFDVTKNGFITSKRMSRMMRDYRMFERLPENEVSLEYLDLDKSGEEIWDGAGLISRSMLERLQISPNLSAETHERLREELKHIGRVEFTLVNSAGQHKGHAIVVDNMEVDFRLPRDIKKDARTTNGTAFIGLNAVHSKDDMRLDVQSVMNLHPFISSEQMLGYLEEEGTLFREAVESGKKAEAMARLERASQEDLEAWPLRHFFARGGDANWFPGMVKELLNGHIQRLEVSLERGKLRIPFNGGRYYVMTSDVAEAAGLKIQVAPGQVHLDPNTSTAWVNRDDWLQMPESQEGIKHILGGADQDDALWVHGFTDHDGSRKILAWRSPNNTGEYVTLRPTQDSQPMLWHTPSGETVMYPEGDSRKLTARIDQTVGQTQYLNLAQDPQEGELGQGKAYTPELMEEVNQRTLENSGILGGYCNFTMGFKGTVGRTPKVLPDTLERVIDNDVKLGGSNALVGEKIEEMTLQFLQSGVPIPKFLLPRFGVYPDPETGAVPSKKKFVLGEGEEKKEIWVTIRTTDGNHWVDHLSSGVHSYLQNMTQYRDEKMANARLPTAVHDSIAGDTEALRLGARFNSLYTQSLREARSKYAHVITTSPHEDYRQHEAQRKQYNNLVMGYVRQKSESFLEEQPEERQTIILRGAMVSREMNAKDPKKTTSDSAFWQRGKVAETSLRSLQELGLLGEIVEETGERGTRLMRYPVPEKAQKQANYQPVEIKQVWFNREIAGKDSPPSMKGIEPATQKQRKAEVRTLAQRSREQGGFLGQKLRVGERYFGMDAAPSMVFEDEAGHVFGVIPKKHAPDWLVGEQVIIRQAKGSDGNLSAMVERTYST
jgi:hypothetical protein